MTINLATELKIMHACELGAQGVYRGHKCAARYFFRKHITDLDAMRDHETEHTDLFFDLLLERGFRPCRGYMIFFYGGLIYGVAIGLLGPKAIGQSTHTIEVIVDREICQSIDRISQEPLILCHLQKVLSDERSHQETGKDLAGSTGPLNRFVGFIATKSAYLAKFLATHL